MRYLVFAPSLKDVTAAANKVRSQKEEFKNYEVQERITPARAVMATAAFMTAATMLSHYGGIRYIRDV